MPRETDGTVPRLRTRLAGALLSVLALTLTGCGGGATPAATASAKASALANRVEPLTDTPVPQLPVTVRSADGKKVTVKNARRIVPVSGRSTFIAMVPGVCPGASMRVTPGRIYVSPLTVPKSLAA